MRLKPIALQELEQATNGTLYHPKPLSINGIVIDNRLVTPGCLFVAIQGERFDGHDFIPSAIEQGAVAVVSQKKLEISTPYLLVEDTRKALLDLGRYCRQQFHGKLVGVTGSVGKTTTKEMIATVLSSQYHTLKTEGNLNNEIGLPKTLFGLDDRYQAAVIEMGMSNLGEIHRLSTTALPDIGVITNIGVSHMENLGSRANILKAKLEILDGMEEGAPLIVNGDNDMLCNLQVENHPVIFCGISGEHLDCRATNIKTDGLSTTFEIVYQDTNITVSIPTIGEHNVLNALFGFVIGRLSGITSQQIVEALKKYQPAGMRQNTRLVNGMIVIEDCYNASPDSMKAAFSALQQIPAEGRKIAVLGDMLELGKISSQAHYDTGVLAKQCHLDALFCYGPESKQIAAGAKGIPFLCHYDDKQKMASDLKAFLRPGDAVIFKASRGMKLEEVIQELFQKD